MLCSACHYTNPEGMDFCIDCGAPLNRACPACQFSNPPVAKFCGRCGGPLIGAASETLKTAPPHSISTESALAQARTTAPASGLGSGNTICLFNTPPRTLPLDRGSHEAERRQITVLFCDLVGSTILAERLDPEDLHRVMQMYQEVCSMVLHRYEGHVAQYLGDGIVVYFGYPIAHEDDPQRAVRTGLGIVAELNKLNTRLRESVRGLGDTGLQIRIGIHTGLVVVADLGQEQRREQVALGETPNIASRLQNLADPNTVLVSAASYQLTSGFFDYEDLGERLLRGISHPLRVFRVASDSGVQNRFEIAMSAGLNPLVGRDAEVDLLIRRWEYAQDGVGQVILLSGEAGIGKSRLVQALKERVQVDYATRIDCRCSPYHQTSALFPIIELLHRSLNFGRDDTAEIKLEKLTQALAGWREHQPECVATMATLLSLTPPDASEPSLEATATLSPQQQKEKTQQIVLGWLLAKTEDEPVLAVVEDLHWADPSTLELLGLLIDQAPTARLLLMLTYRPEFIPPWPARSHLTPLGLSRLPLSHAERVVSQLTAGKKLPAEVLRHIITKTDGVPLFIEELTKMVLGSGLVKPKNNHYELTGPLPPLAIPATLQDSLMARLDRLDAVKEVAQLGATLGREFSLELMQAVSGLDETLHAVLARLVEAEVLYQRGIPPHAYYLFKHALIQDAAYQSLLKSRRQQYHQQIAQVLETQFPNTCETQPELLAHHYTQAELLDKAIAFWQRAGAKAIARFANAEAIAHLSKALELLRRLPAAVDTSKMELGLCLALGIPLMATKGPAAREVGELYDRARELSHTVGDKAEQFRVLRGLARIYLVRAEFRKARELGEQLLELAEGCGDPAALLGAHYALGSALCFIGEFQEADKHLTEGIALYDPLLHRADALVHGALDAGVGCLVFGAHTLWYLGYADQALRRAERSLALAKDLAHPYSLTGAQVFAAWVHMLRGEPEAAIQCAEAGIALAREQGLSLYLALGTMLRGWAISRDRPEAIEQIRHGLDAFQSSGGQMASPLALTVLAEHDGNHGKANEGLELIAKALQSARLTGEGSYEAEMHRIRGELLLKIDPGNVGEARACFEQAIAVAQRQRSKMLELRASTSLSRLLEKSGAQEEARDTLVKVLDWFTEGHDTADLREARTLADTLAHSKVRGIRSARPRK